MLEFGKWTLGNTPDKINQNYICTMDDGRVEALRFVKTSRYNSSIIRWQERNGSLPTGKVVAYMPFPEKFNQQG